MRVKHYSLVWYILNYIIYSPIIFSKNCVLPKIFEGHYLSLKAHFQIKLQRWVVCCFRILWTKFCEKHFILKAFSISKSFIICNISHAIALKKQTKEHRNETNDNNNNNWTQEQKPVISFSLGKFDSSPFLLTMTNFFLYWPIASILLHSFQYHNINKSNGKCYYKLNKLVFV